MGTWLKQLLLFCVGHQVLSVRGLSSQAEGGGQAGFPAGSFRSSCWKQPLGMWFPSRQEPVLWARAA